jgi:hypothetical protein
LESEEILWENKYVLTEVDGRMTKKYSTPREEEQMKALYKTGKYTFKQIGEKFFVSKSTAINIIKGYPYTGDKVEYWQTIYRDAVSNTDEVLADIRNDMKQSLAEHDSLNYYMLINHEEYIAGFSKIDPKQFYENIKNERTKIEQSAWGALSKHRYEDFAFFQSLWHRINKIMGDNKKNPFNEIPEKSGAKSRTQSLRYHSNKDLREYRHYCRNVPKNGFIVSDSLFQEVQHCLHADTGRTHKNPKKRLNDILDLFCSGDSPKKHGDWRKIYQSFDTWYKSGLFRALWEVHEKFQELEAIRNALLYIERHRMVNPDKPPRIKDVQDANKQ